MTLLEELARLLAQLQLGVYDDTGTTGNLFLDRLPPQPDDAYAIARYGAGMSDSKLPYDTLGVQVRVRGNNTDSRDAEGRAQAVYDQLHGLAGRTLPGGTWLVLCVGAQGGPISIGPDEHGRPEWTISFRVELERRTANRP